MKLSCSGSESVCDMTSEKEKYPAAVKNPGQVAKGTGSSLLKKIFKFSLRILVSELISLF